MVLLLAIVLLFASDHVIQKSGPYIFGSFLVIVLSIAVLQAAFGLGALKLRCPFCDKARRVWSPRSSRLRLDCPSCGWIGGSGFLGTRASKTKEPDLR
jgi:hypothetical protein